MILWNIKFLKTLIFIILLLIILKSSGFLASITQKRLADRTVSLEYIRQIEAPNRTSGFTIESVYVISKALSIPMEVLFETKKDSTVNINLVSISKKRGSCY